QSVNQTPPEPLADADPGAPTRARELAQPSRDLPLDHPAQAARTQRLPERRPRPPGTPPPADPPPSSSTASTSNPPATRRSRSPPNNDRNCGGQHLGCDHRRDKCVLSCVPLTALS